MTTQEAIEFAKIRLNNIERAEKYLVTKNEKLPPEQQQYKEFYQHILQIAERAGDEEGIAKVLYEILHFPMKFDELQFNEKKVFIDYAHSLSRWLKGEK